MTRTGSIPVVALLLLATPMTAGAQGLMTGTGLGPSTQVATPPSAPAIDQPGAEQRALAQHRRNQRMRAIDRSGTTGTTTPATTPPR